MSVFRYGFIATGNNMLYKHLLATIDLSPRSSQIIERAVDLATYNNATLDVVYVIEHLLVTYVGELSIPININLAQTIKSEAQKALTELCQKSNIPPERKHILSGCVKQTIIELAEKLNIDLIIIGAHNYHGLDKLLSSRTNAIIHRALCDVLTVQAKE